MYFSTPNANLRFLASMHALPASAPRLPDWTVAAYDWSECLVFESELGPAAFAHFVAEDATPLSAKLSPQVHRGLSELWVSNPSLPALDTLRPWAAAMLSALALSPKEPGIEPIFSIWAAEDGKPLEYLEAASAFPVLADAIPLQTIDRTLATMLGDTAVAKRSQARMHEAWVTRDLRSFLELALEAPLLREPDIKSALLDARNEAWATKLQSLMTCQRRTLVAVGALHLFVGPTAQHFAGIDLHAL